MLKPLALACLTVCAVFASPLPAKAQAGGEVHGSIYALVRAAGTVVAAVPGGGFADRYVFLPDISVFLQNTQTNAVTAPVTTNLDGSFAVPSQPEATYKLCWKAARYAAGCGTSFVLHNVNLNLQPQGIVPDPGIVLGRVTLKDNSSCRFVVPFLGVNSSTTVTAQLPSNATVSVRANSYGEYVIPGVPAGSIKLTAACEDGRATGTATMSGSAVVANLTLPSAKPSALAYASLGGQVVRAAAPGTTVQVTIKAKAGGAYPLHYRWAPDPASSGFVSQDATTVNWTIPAKGLATLYVLTHDDHGGNLLSHVSLSTTPDRILFSGKVFGNNAPAVSGAIVAINGVTATTDALGGFLLALPKEAPRYVLSITKPGYRLFSRALYAPVVGGSYELFQAQDFTVDPRKEISVTERPAETVTAVAAGARISIAANALAAGADGKGALATTPLHVYMASYALHEPQDQLPGDYGGIDKSGKGQRLSTYGAVSIDIRDASGNPHNLAPGKTATVTVPIDPAMQAGAPATMPVWYYDTARGMWVEEGTATKVGNAYQAKVTHFSAVNMDLAFSNAACTIIQVDTTIMPTPFKVRMTPLSGGFTVQANHQDQTIGDAINVVVREPPNIQVQFDMVDSVGNIITGASQTVNTGNATPDGVEWNPPPNQPYDCGSTVTYNEQTVKALFPLPPGFLTYLTPAAYLDPAQAPALTAAYYAAIDPGGTKTAPNNTSDFANWKTLNGFDRAGETRAIFQNLYDLGFGRDMHMQQGGQSGTCANCIAYYVTNYQTLAAADAAPGNGGANQLATVAMEYSPQNNVSGTPYTKFYVYGANGAILDSVALDDFAPKFVPTLCIICHNGNINSMGPDGSLPFARFIGFDEESYGFATSGAYSEASQTGFLKTMNAGVMNNTNVSTPLKLLITDWYGTEGNTSLPGPFNPAAVPTAWTTPVNKSALYGEVVKKSCRACHTTRDPADTGQDISWGSYDSFNNDGPVINIYTCSPAGSTHHIMPQAERTFSRFWLSTAPNEPPTLASSGINGFPAGSTCK